MSDPLGNTLPRSCMLKGQAAVSSLMREGKYGYSGCLKYCWKPSEASHLMVAVPKKIFKRAVKRNLMKRRIREAYRTQRELLQGVNADIMFIYNAPDICDSAAVAEAVAGAFSKIATK